MARGRFISRSISANEQLAGVSVLADYFFRACIPHLDVDGRISGNPVVLKAAVCPLREELTSKMIPDLIQELAAAVDADGCSLVVWYEKGPQKVLYFPGFADHQELRRDREGSSKLPRLEDATRIACGTDGGRQPRPKRKQKDSLDISGSLPGVVPGELPESSAPSVSEAEGEVEVEVQPQDKGEAVDLEHPTAGDGEDGPSADPRSGTASPAAQESGKASPLPRSAQQLLRDRYGVPKRATWSALTPRQKQVAQDLRATLGDRGAVLEKGVRVRAVDAEHLEAACAHVLAKTLERSDAAIQHVLLYLRDTWLEVKAAREKADRGETPATRSTNGRPEPVAGSVRRLIFQPPDAEAVAAAENWLATLAEAERATTERAIAAKVQTICGSSGAPSWREQMRRSALIEAYQKAMATYAEGVA